MTKLCQIPKKWELQNDGRSRGENIQSGRDRWTDIIDATLVLVGGGAASADRAVVVQPIKD